MREVTGNEWVSFPDIDLGGGGLLSLTALHEGAGGLLELAGLPARGGQLLAPALYERPVEPAGTAWQPVDIDELRWEREEEWLPGWVAEPAGFALSARIFAPPGHRGAVCRLTVENRSGAAREVTLGLAGTWAETRQVLLTSRPVNALNHAWFDESTQSLVLESRPGTSLVGWAVGCDQPLSTCLFEAVPARQAAADFSLQLELGLEAAAGPAHPWRARLGQLTARPATGAVVRFFAGCALTLAPGEAGEAAFFLALGTDADGARLALADLRRRGASALHEAARRDLRAKAVKLNPARLQGSAGGSGGPARTATPAQAAARLEALLNRNLTFNRFFATGRALDTGRLALVTSRSPECEVKGAFSARDAFFWSFPALLLADRPLAREALVLGLTRYAPHSQFQLCYLDGRPLSPGFQLDGLAAPLWAFDHYLERTNDLSLWAEPGVEEGLRLILRRFLALAEPGREGERDGLGPDLIPLRRGRGMLLPTFLDSSGDPTGEHPYLTFSNLLAWRALTGFARQVERRRGWEEERRQARELADFLQEGLKENLLCGRAPRQSFALGTDGRASGLVMGDNPAGSLALLAHLGFCDRLDPVFQHTLAGLNFPGNPFYAPGPFGGRGNRRAPFPWVVARAADLLTGDPTALSFFLGAPLDQGLACEAVDPRTGEVKTGPAYAAASGWLAWCLHQTLGRKM